MKDRSWIDTMNLTFIALTATAIHYCLSAWKMDVFRVVPEFGPGGGAQHKCDTRHIDHVVDNSCPDAFCFLKVDFHTSLPEVQANKIDSIRSPIHWRIDSTGAHPAMTQPHNDQGMFDENILDYVPYELIEQPDNSFNCISSFVAATEASMRFSAVLLMGGSAIASSSPSTPVTATATAMTSLTSPALRIWY